MKANNAQREARMRRQIKDIVATELLYNSKDPDLEFVTITDVELTGDLQNATIFWTLLGDEEDIFIAQKALGRVSGRVRKALASKLGTRLAPTVKFLEDSLQSNVSSIEQLLDKATHLDKSLEQARVGRSLVNENNSYKNDTISEVQGI